LASYAIVANYFTDTPISAYFQGYCKHFGIACTDAADAERKYAEHFDAEWRKRNCRGYEVILDLHSNSTVECFAEARRHFYGAFYLDSDGHREELEKRLAANEAFLNITYEPGRDYHSITVIQDGPRLVARDTNRKGLFEISALAKIGKLRDSVLYLAAAAPKPSSVAAATQDPPAPDSTANTLTDAEKAAGWKLLFNGKDFSGWHNFKRDDVLPGWQVKDGALVCADPHNAKDIVTSDSFGWFELQLDYNISEGGNSGIMFHVTDEGGSAWATGPEFQLEDNAKAADPQRCGWLYALYQPPIDPKTDNPLDATKPAGEWNHVRLVLSPEKCIHEINGVKYFEYILGSDDFKERVAKSKFARMPHFAKSDTGFIALQGDHGQVSFRNIKVRTISAPPKNS